MWDYPGFHPRSPVVGEEYFQQSLKGLVFTMIVTLALSIPAILHVDFLTYRSVVGVWLAAPSSGARIVGLDRRVALRAGAVWL